MLDHCPIPNTEVVLNLEILRGLSGGSSLVRGYLAGEGAALDRFGGSYRDPAAFRLQMESVDRRFDRAARERAARAIRAPHPAGEALLRRVVEEGGFFVTTGQQPGLFTGPLYSVYKALTAILAASALQALLERPVAPLFWVASEDHDWAEVDHAYLVDAGNDLHRVSLPGIPGGREDRPLFRCPFDEGITQAVDRFVELLPRSDFVDSDIILIREAWAPGRTMGGAFADALGSILGSAGLLLVDAADPALKEASLPLLLDEAAEGVPREQGLARVAARLEAEGRPPQVPILEGGVNLFLEGPAGRERLYREEGGFRLRHSGTRLSLGELQTRVADDPAALSPNVLLRPVVESAVFPVLTYVAGPGEMAYWGQIREYFEAHGIRMPLVTPRDGATLLEPKVRKVLDKFGLQPEDLARPPQEVLAAALREEIPGPVKQAMGEFRGSVARSAAELVRAVREIDSTLKGPVESARNQAFKGLEEVERKVVQALKRQNEIAVEQLEKAAIHLHPLGRPQERVMNLFYYTSRYGRGMVDALLGAFDPGLEAHTPLPTPGARA
jgi:bacillithiol synthase